MTSAAEHRPGTRESFAYCERLAASHYENFTVVSWLFPKALRDSMYSIYAFCRETDDLGDEAQGDRIALLDEWEGDLLRCFRGTPGHPVMTALQQTVRRHAIPMEPFLKLIEANRMDQRVLRHSTYGDLVHYCDHSANPVGHMVLHVFGYDDAERQALSDATCTALQLANFWQDVRRDYAMGRIYLPQEDMERFGYTEQELSRNEFNRRFRDLMEFQVDRARRLFHEGSGLVGLVNAELRLDLKLFTSGGLSILNAIKGQGYDVLTRRPVVSKSKKVLLAMRGITELAGRRALRGLGVG